MMFITHLSFALFLGLLVVRFVSVPANNFIFIAIILAATLVPDLDSTESFLGKKLKPLNIFFKHRGFFHSLLLGVVLAILVFGITSNSYYALGFLLGYGSHLFLDSLTKGGVAFFWPHKTRIRGKLRTGGIIDRGLFLVFMVVDVAMLVYVF